MNERNGCMLRVKMLNGDEKSDNLSLLLDSRSVIRIMCQCWGKGKVMEEAEN